MDTKHRPAQGVLEAESPHVVRCAQSIGSSKKPVSPLVQNRTLSNQSRGMTLLAILLPTSFHFNGSPDETIEAGKHLLVNEALLVKLDVPVLVLWASLLLQVALGSCFNAC